MLIIARRLFRTLAIALFLLVGADIASAQPVIVAEYPPPRIAYYQPGQTVVAYSLPPVIYGAPTVSYYSPRVAYSPVRTVTYFAPPVESYYAQPMGAYYPGPVTTTRYGLFGQPRETKSYYPTYVLPR
ncbi:MAG: hypothetical protein K8U57_06895 [Planctomycetes bacterium]|nr:hypothetical protein [Planctomycetota bacterium]